MTKLIEQQDVHDPDMTSKGYKETDPRKVTIGRIYCDAKMMKIK